MVVLVGYLEQVKVEKAKPTFLSVEEGRRQLRPCMQANKLEIQW